MRKKKMGAPLKRNTKLLGTGITADLDSRYRTLAEASFIRKTELKRLALEYVMAHIESGVLAVHREHHETTIVGVALPETEYPKEDWVIHEDESTEVPLPVSQESDTIPMP